MSDKKVQPDRVVDPAAGTPKPLPTDAAGNAQTISIPREGIKEVKPPAQQGPTREGGPISSSEEA
jgi:hypothetical protein